MSRGLVLVILALAVAPAGGAASGWHVIATNHAYAIYAKVDVSASVLRPAAVALRVSSAPPQVTSVKWSLVCSRGGRTASTSGSYSPKTMDLQQLRLPMGSPRSCRVAAHGYMPNGGGTLTLTIYSRA